MILLFSSLAFADTELIRHFLADETAGTVLNDASNNTNGTVTNALIWSEGGKINGCLNTTAFYYGSYTAPITGNWSVSTWFNFVQITSFDKLWGGGNGGGTFAIDFPSETIIRFNGGDNTFEFTVPEMSSNLWYNVIVIRNGTETRLYLNTTESSTGAGANGNPIPNTNFNIGASLAGGGNFNGCIDDFRVYNGSISSATRECIYNSDVGTQDVCLVIIDTTPPIIQLGINNTAPSINEIVNISFNVTGEPTGVVNVTINWTTGLTIYNYTVSGDVDLHNITTITDTRGNVLNISVCAVDALDNYGCSSTKITVGNSISTPTIILPTPDDYNNTNTNYPFNITFPADGDGDTITIYYYINGKLNQTSSTNVTFNASDGYYILNISLYDGIGFGTNATVNFTIDTILPILLVFNLTNNTLFEFNVNATFNITIQDTNPYNLTYRFYNSSNSSIFTGYNDIINSSTTISIVNLLDLTSLASGNYSMEINFSDTHTSEKIGDYDFRENSNGFIFDTAEGSRIEITDETANPNIFQRIIYLIFDNPNIKSVKKLDRYTLEFGISDKAETRIFRVLADKKINIIKGSEYKGHLTVSDGFSGNWIDFENDDKDSTVTITRVSEYEVLVYVTSKDFNFKSLGGLNIVNVFYNFQVDNDAPVVSSSVNNTAPSINEIVNISANATDIIAVSTVIIGHNNSGSWVNVSNSTVTDDTTNIINLDYLLTITASQGSTIGTMACANDTFNQFSCGSVQTIQVNDTTIPTIVTGNNATRFLSNLSINFTYNVTDNFLLSIGQVIITENDVIKYFNFSLTGTSAEFSQNFTISASAGDYINVTGRVNDSYSNSIQITTIFQVTKDLFVNASNSYDNTTILSFTATLSNASFSETQTTTDGSLNFSNIISGIFNLSILSDQNGGYHNATYVINASNDFEARLHQAIVYFTAVRRGTDVAVLDYNLFMEKAANTSNSTGGLRFLLNASKFVVNGRSDDYFDITLNITLGNQSTSRQVAEFYDINVSIAIFSVVNNSWLHNFSITLDGTSFTETQTDSVGVDEGNLTFSLGNGTYNIEVMHPDFATAFFSFVLLSNDTFPNLTFSMLGLNSINFSVFDEITELLLPENASIILVSDDFFGNFTADDGKLYLQNIIAGDYRITYSALKYTQRDYFVSILNDSNQSIDLYLLSITNGTDVTFTVQDNSGNELTNATIRLKRYYISTNSYRIVAMARTNEEGEALIDVDFNDAYYELLVTFNEFSLRTIGTRIISLTRILTMDLIPPPFDTVDAINDITTSLTFNNVSQTFSYVFTDLTGVNREATLDVIKTTPTTSDIVCTSTDTTSSGTLLCVVNTTNITGTYTAKGFITISGNKILMRTKEISTGIVSQFKSVWGTQGIFFTILVAGVLGGLGAAISPAVGIIMFIVGIAIASFLGMSIISMVFLAFLVLAAAIIIFKMKR